MESLFVECVEEVRREVIKRKLKAEIINKKKIGQFEANSEEAREFEESLLKLANLAKNRVKIQDFTKVDRSNLLDLFVNNEKTLLMMYEALFPKVQHSKRIANSMRNLPNLQASTDNLPYNASKELLKGDSIYQ